MRDPLQETYIIIERTRRLDPEAFARHVGPDGMPGPFVDPDDDRRLAAYQKARATVSEKAREEDKLLFRGH